MRDMRFAPGHRRHRVATALTLVGIALAGAARAEDSPAAGADRPVVEKLLDILLQQQSITRDQYQELLLQSRREQAEAAARAAEVAKAAPTPPVSAGPAWNFKWDNGFNLEREDGAFKLRFGGRTQLDGAVIEETSALNEDLRALGGNGQGNGVEFRRARIYFDGTVYDRLFFRSQFDFATGNVQFKDVYMGLRDLGPVGTLQVGQFKEPFYLDEMTTDDNITFMERPTSNVFFPDRQVGVMAMNNLLDKRMLWQVATFREANTNGFAFSSFDSSSWDVATRIAGSPVYTDDGARVVHLGFDYIHRFVGQSIRYQQRPESHLADFFLSTPNLPASTTDTLPVPPPPPPPPPP